jgi:hypothetical protein
MSAWLYGAHSALGYIGKLTMSSYRLWKGSDGDESGGQYTPLKGHPLNDLQS